MHKARVGGEFAFAVDERNWRSRVWHPSLRRARLRAIRIHDARHTHASLLIGSGADVVAVSRRLGHSNPSVTLTTYSHASALRDAAPLGERLAEFMRREAGGCVLVAPSAETAHAAAQGAAEAADLIVDSMVARGGIPKRPQATDSKGVFAFGKSG